MTVTIQLSDDQAAALQAQGCGAGPVDAWLHRLAEQYARLHAAVSSSPADERAIWEFISDSMKDLPRSSLRSSRKTARVNATITFMVIMVILSAIN